MPRKPAAKESTAAAALPATRRSAGSPRRRTDEVVEAAAAVFAERGYHGATTQDIADQLGIRQATLYYYFPSKDVALELVCQRGVDDFIERAEAAAALEGSVKERLDAIIRAHLQAIDDKHAFVRVFLNERQHLQDAARKRVGKLSRRYERIIQAVFEAGVASGELRAGLNCRMATLALLALCNAAASWYGKEPGATIGAIGAAFGELIWEGVGAIPAAAPAAARRRGK